MKLTETFAHIRQDFQHNIAARRKAPLPDSVLSIVSTEIKQAILLTSHAIKDALNVRFKGKNSEADRLTAYAESAERRREHETIRFHAKFLNEAYDAESPQSRVQHGEALDQLRAEVKQGLSQSVHVSDWDDVLNTTATLSVINNKPDHTQAIQTTLSQLLKSNDPARANALQQAGLEPTTLSKDLTVLANLYSLGENIPTAVGRGGAFTQEQKEKYLFPIASDTVCFLQDHLSHLENVEKFTEAVQPKPSSENKTPLETAGLIVRSIAAMQKPRPWRANNTPQAAGAPAPNSAPTAAPNSAPEMDSQGRRTPSSIVNELLKDMRTKNYDPAVSQRLIEFFAEDKQVDLPPDCFAK